MVVAFKGADAHVLCKALFIVLAPCPLRTGFWCLWDIIFMREGYIMGIPDLSLI